MACSSSSSLLLHIAYSANTISSGIWQNFSKCYVYIDSSPLEEFNFYLALSIANLVSQQIPKSEVNVLQNGSFIIVIARTSLCIYDVLSKTRIFFLMSIYQTLWASSLLNIFLLSYLILQNLMAVGQNNITSKRIWKSSAPRVRLNVYKFQACNIHIINI